MLRTHQSGGGGGSFWGSTFSVGGLLVVPGVLNAIFAEIFQYVGSTEDVEGDV